MANSNLDWSKKDLLNYPFRNYFNYMDNKLNDLNLMQMVDFPIWSRTVNGAHKKSILDHIYTLDPTAILWWQFLEAI
jgi:hypothetical protein